MLNSKRAYEKTVELVEQAGKRVPAYFDESYYSNLVFWSNQRYGFKYTLQDLANAIVINPKYGYEDIMDGISGARKLSLMRI